MVELTEREQKIVHVMHVLINPQLKDVPFDVRKQVIQSQLLVRGIEWNELEITDLVMAVNEETHETSKNALGLLKKFAPQFKNLSKL